MNINIKPKYEPGQEIQVMAGAGDHIKFLIVMKIYKVRGRWSYFYVYKCTAVNPKLKEFYYLAENILMAVD